jgi:hypothetical protein
MFQNIILGLRAKIFTKYGREIVNSEVAAQALN